MLRAMRVFITSLLVAPLLLACDDSGGDKGITNDVSDATPEIGDTAAETAQEVAPETEASTPEVADTTPAETVPPEDLSLIHI